MSNEALRKAVEYMERADTAWAFHCQGESWVNPHHPWLVIAQALRDQEAALATHRANHDALVIRLGEVTTLAESRLGLLREIRDCINETRGAHAYDVVARIDTHLKAADHV